MYNLHSSWKGQRKISARQGGGLHSTHWTCLLRPAPVAYSWGEYCNPESVLKRVAHMSIVIREKATRNKHVSQSSSQRTENVCTRTLHKGRQESVETFCQLRCWLLVRFLYIQKRYFLLRQTRKENNYYLKSWHKLSKSFCLDMTTTIVNTLGTKSSSL